MSAMIIHMNAMTTQHVQIQWEITTVPVMTVLVAMDLIVKVAKAK